MNDKPTLPRRKIFGVFCLAVLLAGWEARAWDPIGHMIVSQIAYDNLAPAAKEKVEKSLAAFNQRERVPYTFVTAACWMDDIRARTKAYNTWHYVTLPFTPEGTPLPDDPNVVWAIELMQGIITGTASHPGIDRDQALVMLIHLVGDVHQPLHATSRLDDAGGNRVTVTNLRDPESDLLFSKGGNLHFFWDSAYRRVFQDGDANVSYAGPLYPREQPVSGHNAALKLVAEQTALLLKGHPLNSLPLPEGDAGEWALESHRLGYTLGYQQLPGGEAANPVTLGKDYVDKARECSQQRQVQAGRRLARLLNGLYGK